MTLGMYVMATWSDSVRFEVFTAVKNALFWDVTPCVPCKNLLFGGTYRLYNLERISELGTYEKQSK
jgi:hypothetical protein